MTHLDRQILTALIAAGFVLAWRWCRKRRS